MINKKNKNPKDQYPKKHHFLPEFFIKRFSERDDKAVFVYEKEYDKLHTIPKPAGSICYQYHLYSLGSGVDRFPILEKGFSFYETKLRDVFDILDGELALANEALSKWEMERLLRFFYACQFWRVPKRRSLAVENAEHLLMLYDDADAENGLVPLSRKDLRKIIKLKIKDDFANVIQNFLSPLLTYGVCRRQDTRFWLIEKPKDYMDDLLCSDTGVIGDTIEEVFSGSEISVFPFSRTRMLIFGKTCDISISAINQFNEKILSSASKHVFCASLGGLQKHVANLKLQVGESK